jgi:hypothetical protein
MHQQLRMLDKSQLADYTKIQLTAEMENERNLNLMLLIKAIL